ncbi:glycoside hydrolase family 71 protein [Serpula lacrymans var. lacrymans S7.3]|uniref:Glycoside hydrolase family 71 protein n=2 Tax=Serpula lacrymans var. lacrymans TaxID=341189 RepID=F8QA86_SERL3|nr:glycoside hydrolase family 71 protein [Serpula lacrymans var. lacrymans S7.9]EGN94676.1 glycoside hydrolase family 71 protein [Serpula lacrymans var. lacrymans S7.3]EGO20158.1 glycoside hydrolase family 71 protein [Serpula lacrymans var. lacrymans S7.9]
MVGNVANYSVSNWSSDIQLASSKGIDAFALNVGSLDWEPAQVANAYSAAEAFGTGFKLFVSLDMSSLTCTTAADGTIVQQYVGNYSSHPNQLMVSGNPMISTFSGESCTFGASSVNDGWTQVLKSGSIPTPYFIPSFFVDPSTFSTYTVMDGAFNWNGGWPSGDTNITFDSDNSYISGLSGKDYMAAVSPWFFTHYGPDSFNKNWIYRFDDWLLSARWELLIANRDSIAFAEIITWNDYGESHYIGPIEGVLPQSGSWTWGFDHQGWLDLITYYIQAFKTGSYPTVSADRLFLWGRLYPEAASCPNDPVGLPQDADWTQDYLWAVALLTSTADVTLSCGSTTQTFTSLPAGANKLQLPFTTDCSVSGTIARNGVNSVDFTPAGFDFQTDPTLYNFNAFVAASPSS